MFTGKRLAESGEGCPLTKWIIRRTDHHEKLLALVKDISQTDVSIVAIVLWDAVNPVIGDEIYEKMVYKTTNFGIETTRGCSLNQSYD